MAHSPVSYDKGTRFTNYSSIHSADAFVGDYQVMYTPGSTSPQVGRGVRKSSRFARAASSQKPANVNQSYLLPSNMPNTSQIMPDHGVLPNLQVHYSIPADEKQIVASLRSLQRDLEQAVQTINELTRERDEALHELRLLRAASRKTSLVSKKQNLAARVEEDLFDLSRSEASASSLPSPRKSRQPSQKKVMIGQEANISDDARVLPTVPVHVATTQADRRVSDKAAKDTRKHRDNELHNNVEQNAPHNDDPTAASNTSRRRRRPSLDDNMTSAYILPDITEHNEVVPHAVSREAQQVIHSLEPDHVRHCEVCHRLTSKTKSLQEPAHQSKRKAEIPAQTIRQHTAKIDYTAALAGLPAQFQAHNLNAIEESYINDPTMRPKIAPSAALERIKALMQAQFLRAKERHEEAWRKYDSVEAPIESRKHAGIAKEMRHWSEKMEECRVHLDYLRDVEEGVGGSESD